MQLLPSFAYALFVFPLTVTAATVEISKRSLWSSCNTWATTKEGPYTIYQNLWGVNTATSGSQCMEVTSYSANRVAWTTTWTWAGNSIDVKSYDNIAYTLSAGVQLSSILSIPTTWVWSQKWSGSTPISDISYDLMTASSSDLNASHNYEIMIWLAAYGGALPMSSTGSAIANPTIAGHSWSLYSDYRGSTQVFSFVSSTPITSFSGDLMHFLDYLSTNNGLSKSQYLTVLESGTEPFIGTSVTFTTTQYSISLNQHSSSSVTGTQPVYGQCGGQNWTGPTACASGTTCKYMNAWYSQCIPS